MSRKRRQEQVREPEGLMSRAGSLARDNPVAAGGAAVMALTGCLIIANAVGLQTGRHPAPLYATRERPVIIEPQDRRTAETPEVSSLVLELQNALRRVGIYEGPLDGINGPATERAIRHYERLQGKPETGQPSEGLLALIVLQGTIPAPIAGGPVPVPKPAEEDTYVPPVRVTASVPAPVSSPSANTAPVPPAPVPVLNVPPENRRLAKIQELLSDLGYGPLRADGVMGENTSSAIRRFELDRGLPITGNPSDAVVARLELVSGATIPQ
ncbi:peptidoglycan-binding domain-containing protein [Roseibium litorale]|uniref:Peptidoglycan-binding protein n=1 Tax=Roseibium litorale TaxID=2803841 RepID=A0ABR9CRN8_9HYPH|nr:peptidoglycan-binding domain-containing protein [Roseibium litorale]MBD8893528.1 peptidoglycan-binding protein [Roseibium litorale]